MAKKASKHEEGRYSLRGDHWYTNGEWTFYSVLSGTGKSVVGTCSIRSGGGWICTLDVFGTEDNGIQDVRRRVGYAKGYGATPQEALDEADRKSLEGITSAAEAAQMELN